MRSRRRRAPPHHHTTTTRARVSVPGNHPHTRSPAACVAGSTKSACSRSRRGGPRLARCACARSAESRRAQSTPLSFGAKWRDDATAAIARARNVGSLSLTLERDAAGELSGNSSQLSIFPCVSTYEWRPPSFPVPHVNAEHSCAEVRGAGGASGVTMKPCKGATKGGDFFCTTLPCLGERGRQHLSGRSIHASGFTSSGTSPAGMAPQWRAARSSSRRRCRKTLC